MRRTIGLPRVFATGLLGLPVAFMAHALAFGSTHSWGGSAEAILVDATLLAGSIVAVALFVAATLSARETQTGSIAASHVRALLPKTPELFASAGFWFVIVEAVEAPHREAALACILALAAATLLFRFTVCALTRCIAEIALCMTSQLVMTVGSVPSQQTLGDPAAPAGTRCPDRRLLFTRPPPLFA